MLPLTATELLRCYDNTAQVDRTRFASIDALASAMAIQHEIVTARVARGERPVGYKIGFTNRTIWAKYGVSHPIWAPMYDSTVRSVDSAAATIDANNFVEPRLEPEMVIRLASAPAEATPSGVAQSLEWVAHGIEIVQSPFHGWSFSAAESVAAQGLHGALLIGPRFAARELVDRAERLPDFLAGVSLSLFCDGEASPVDSGAGSNVLDGPLHAVAYLMTELARAGSPPLKEGDIITTGTMTDAQPLHNGQHWHTTLTDAADLAGMALTVASTA